MGGLSGLKVDRYTGSRIGDTVLAVRVSNGSLFARTSKGQVPCLIAEWPPAMTTRKPPALSTQQGQAGRARLAVGARACYSL